jgi:Predicted membrane protein (DUF2306)
VPSDDTPKPADDEPEAGEEDRRQSMSTIPPETRALNPAATRGFAKPVFWAATVLMAIFVLFASEFPLLSPAHPDHARLDGERLILIPHALAGLATVLIGPLQFSSRLRQRNIRRHRMLGKVYVGAIAIAAPFAILLGRGAPIPLAIATDVQAALWVICTLAAFLTARNRHIAQHRVWVVRSYGITLIFFFARVLNPLPAYRDLSPETFACVLFILLLCVFLIPDLFMHRRELTSRR